MPGEELVGQDGQREYVVPGVRVLAFEHLESGIGRRESPELRRVEQRGLAFLRMSPLDLDARAMPKSRSLTVLVAGDEAVPGLQIRVHQSVLVGVGESGGQLLDDGHCVFDGQAVLAGRARIKASRGWPSMTSMVMNTVWVRSSRSKS